MIVSILRSSRLLGFDDSFEGNIKLNGENRNRTCEAFTPSRFQGGVLDQPDSLQYGIIYTIYSVSSSAYYTIKKQN